MALITLTCTSKDGLADATSVVLSSANGSYGILNLATGDVVVPNNTPVLQHYVTGIYQYNVSSLASGVPYQVSWQITYNGTIRYVTVPFSLGTAMQLSDVKAYLRIDASDTSFDEEIQDLMTAAQTDLIEVGVNPDGFNRGDPLLKKAITTYCKAYFGYDTDNAPAFASSYEKLKVFLMNCNDYQPLVVALDNFGSPGSRL